MAPGEVDAAPTARHLAESLRFAARKKERQTRDALNDCDAGHYSEHTVKAGPGRA